MGTMTPRPDPMDAVLRAAHTRGQVVVVVPGVGHFMLNVASSRCLRDVAASSCLSNVAPVEPVVDSAPAAPPTPQSDAVAEVPQVTPSLGDEPDRRVAEAARRRAIAARRSW